MGFLDGDFELGIDGFLGGLGATMDGLVVVVSCVFMSF